MLSPTHEEVPRGKALTDQLLLVPTEQHVERAAVAGLRAITLRRLIGTLVEPYAQEYAATTPEMTRLMTASVLGTRHSLAPSVDNAIGTLRRAGIGREQLATIKNPRAELFCSIIEQADSWLSRAKLRDERADAWLAAAALANGAPCPAATSMRVSGFARWDNATLCLLEALHRTLRERGGEGVTVELPAPHTALEANATEGIAKSLETRWAHAADSPALSFVEPRTAESSPPLRLIAAASTQAEARTAVHCVLEALSAGHHLDRLALVALDLSEAFMEPLRSELTRARIPFTEPRGRPAVAAPHTHAALTLMRLARGSIARDAVVDLLRTPDLSFNRWVGKKPHAHQRLAHALEEIPIGIDRSGEDLPRLLAGHRDGSWSSEAYGQLLKDVTRCGQPAPRAEMARAWQGLFSELGILSTPTRSLETAIREADSGFPLLMRALSDDARNRGALVEAMTRLTAAASALGLAEQQVDAATFFDELEHALSGVGRARGAARAGALRIARPSEVVGLDLEWCILCGVTAGNVDAPSGQTERLLGDRLLASLPEELRPPSSQQQQNFSELELGWLTTAARRSVAVYSERDSGGRPERACHWLRRLKLPTEREPASPLTAHARVISAIPAPTEEVKRRIAVEAERLAYFLDPQMSAGIHTGSTANLKAWIGGDTPDNPLAVTRLESYARCGFLGFASIVLRAARDEEVEESIGYREAGRLLHEALARALKAAQSLWATQPRDIIREAAIAEARAYLESEQSSPLRRAGLAATLLDVATFIDWSLDHRDGFNFHSAEIGFGERGSWQSLELAGAHFRGRIDRIDWDQSRRRLRVIDYKSGRLPTHTECAQLLLQPWLYAMKAAREMDAQEVTTGYLAKSNRSPSWRSVHAGSVGDPALTEAGERAAQQLNALWAGRIDPRPVDPKLCLRCEARDICRRPPSAPDPDEANS